MRIFFIFKINNKYYNLYRNNPDKLYYILNKLYNIKTKEEDSIELLKDIIIRINRSELDKSIFIKYHKELYYSKNDNLHVINNLFKDEVSILNIKNVYIHIECNKNYSSFFNILNDLSSSFFVCDFINHDYFWINDIKILV